jgi:hypothetical protein
MLEDNLLHIKTQLYFKTGNKNELRRKYVVNRLSKSLQSYYEDMERRITYLKHRKPENILKRF